MIVKDLKALVSYLMSRHQFINISPCFFFHNLYQIPDVKEFVIKAQVKAGGRGQGHFDNGFKGGVHLTKDKKEAINLVDKMLGHRLITKVQQKCLNSLKNKKV